jgi:hypothetical protein
MPNDPQKDAERRRLQNEMLMMDSDFKKKERQKAELLMDKKRVKMSLDKIQAELAEKDRLLKKLEQEQFVLKNDMGSLKKRMMVL